VGDSAMVRQIRGLCNLIGDVAGCCSCGFTLSPTARRTESDLSLYDSQCCRRLVESTQCHGALNGFH
jgi:hypothetical protein